MLLRGTNAGDTFQFGSGVMHFPTTIAPSNEICNNIPNNQVLR